MTIRDLRELLDNWKDGDEVRFVELDTAKTFDAITDKSGRYLTRDHFRKLSDGSGYNVLDIMMEA
jgi:hypothetical protein